VVEVVIGGGAAEEAVAVAAAVEVEGKRGTEAGDKEETGWDWRDRIVATCS
jgi:hypothetical protein